MQDSYEDNILYHHLQAWDYRATDYLSLHLLPAACAFCFCLIGHCVSSFLCQHLKPHDSKRDIIEV